MFIAEHVTELSLRFCSFEENEDFIRTLSSEGQLICPDCRENVRYRAGTKRPHFFHKRECKNPNPFHENESETHRSGKVAIYQWLKRIYPKCSVELEYYLSETKQRSDVMVIHPNGDRWAFEFQCSKIPETIWLERHHLYQKAGVTDFWILNHDIVRYDGYSARVRALEAALHKDSSRIQYLNTQNESVFFMMDGTLHGDDLVAPVIFETSLENMTIEGSKLWINEFTQYEIQKEEEQKEKDRLVKISKLQQLQKNNHFRLQSFLQQRMQESRKIPLSETYKHIKQDRYSFRNHFTEAEDKLFNSLCLKHGFSSNNFPGILHLNLLYSELIITPPQLWQLWIFDEVVQEYAYCLKNKKTPRIWLDRTKERFIKLRKNGFLRIKNYPSHNFNYIYTMYEYIDKLNEYGVLFKLGTKYYDILVNEIPLLLTHKENIFLNMAFSGYIHPSLQDIQRLFYDEVSKIRATCIKVQFDATAAKYASHNNIQKLSEFDAQLSHEVDSSNTILDLKITDQEHVVSIARLEEYRDLLVRCKSSQLLDIYPALNNLIKQAEAIFMSYDQSHSISWDNWCKVFNIIENIKRPLLGE